MIRETLCSLLDDVNRGYIPLVSLCCDAGLPSSQGQSSRSRDLLTLCTSSLALHLIGFDPSPDCSLRIAPSSSATSRGVLSDLLKYVASRHASSGTPTAESTDLQDCLQLARKSVETYLRACRQLSSRFGEPEPHAPLVQWYVDMSEILKSNVSVGGGGGVVGGGGSSRVRSSSSGAGIPSLHGVLDFIAAQPLAQHASSITVGALSSSRFLSSSRSCRPESIASALSALLLDCSTLQAPAPSFPDVSPVASMLSSCLRSLASSGFGELSVAVVQLLLDAMFETLPSTARSLEDAAKAFWSDPERRRLGESHPRPTNPFSEPSSFSLPLSVPVVRTAATLPPSCAPRKIRASAADFFNPKPAPAPAPAPAPLPPASSSSFPAPSPSSSSSAAAVLPFVSASAAYLAASLSTRPTSSSGPDSPEASGLPAVDALIGRRVDSSSSSSSSAAQVIPLPSVVVHGAADSLAVDALKFFNRPSLINRVTIHPLQEGATIKFDFSLLPQEEAKNLPEKLKHLILVDEIQKKLEYNGALPVTFLIPSLRTPPSAPREIFTTLSSIFFAVKSNENFAAYFRSCREYDLLNLQIHEFKEVLAMLSPPPLSSNNAKDGGAFPFDPLNDKSFRTLKVEAETCCFNNDKVAWPLPVREAQVLVDSFACAIDPNRVVHFDDIRPFLPLFEESCRKTLDVKLHVTVVALRHLGVAFSRGRQTQSIKPPLPHLRAPKTPFDAVLDGAFSASNPTPTAVPPSAISTIFNQALSSACKQEDAVVQLSSPSSSLSPYGSFVRNALYNVRSKAEFLTTTLTPTDPNFSLASDLAVYSNIAVMIAESHRISDASALRTVVKGLIEGTSGAAGDPRLYSQVASIEYRIDGPSRAYKVLKSLMSTSTLAHYNDVEHGDARSWCEVAFEAALVALELGKATDCLRVLTRCLVGNEAASVEALETMHAQAVLDGRKGAAVRQKREPFDAGNVFDATPLHFYDMCIAAMFRVSLSVLKKSLSTSTLILLWDNLDDDVATFATSNNSATQCAIDELCRRVANFKLRLLCALSSFTLPLDEAALLRKTAVSTYQNHDRFSETFLSDADSSPYNPNSGNIPDCLLSAMFSLESITSKADRQSLLTNAALAYSSSLSRRRCFGKAVGLNEWTLLLALAVQAADQVEEPKTCHRAAARCEAWDAGGVKLVRECLKIAVETGGGEGGALMELWGWWLRLELLTPRGGVNGEKDSDAQRAGKRARQIFLKGCKMNSGEKMWWVVLGGVVGRIMWSREEETAIYDEIEERGFRMGAKNPFIEETNCL